MSTWLELQKNIVGDHEFIAEIEMETITLTRLGGYKATPYSLEQKLLSKPTAKSLKGIWRWWARIAIIGAYYGNVNYKTANEHLNKILGGTYKDEGISHYTLQISDVKFPTNHERKLITIYNEIDKFYDKAKEFLVNQEPQLHLPQNTQVSIRLNPADTVIKIENRRIPLDSYKTRIDSVIKQGPLKDYFINSRLTLKRNNRYHRIVVKLGISELSTYSQIPRIKLLLMKRGTEEEDILTRNNIGSERIRKYLERIKEEMAILVSEGLKFRVLLNGSREVEKVNFILSSFLLSLILGGIGSMTKRGFGSLKLLSFRIDSSLKIDQEIQKIFQELQDKEFTKNELKETLKKLCDITVTYARKVFNISRGQEFQGIPVVPSLSNIRIEVIDCPSLNLEKIGRAFVKQTWKTHPMMQGRDLHTWILGLPRFQEETGYATKIKRDGEIYDFSLRRISSIGARCLKSGNRNFVIVYGLLSSDWYKDLWHIRRNGQPDREKPVKNISIGRSLQNVFDQAFREVLNRVCER